MDLQYEMQMFKTQKCSKYHESTDEAKFCLDYHDKDDLRRKPLKSTNEFRYFFEMCSKKQQCKNKQFCKFSHNKYEQLYHPMAYKISKCPILHHQYFHESKNDFDLNKKKICQYYHDEKEKAHFEQVRLQFKNKYTQFQNTYQEANQNPEPNINQLKTLDKNVNTNENEMNHHTNNKYANSNANKLEINEEEEEKQQCNLKNQILPTKFQESQFEQKLMNVKHQENNAKDDKPISSRNKQKNLDFNSQILKDNFEQVAENTDIVDIQNLKNYIFEKQHFIKDKFKFAPCDILDYFELDLDREKDIPLKELQILVKKIVTILNKQNGGFVISGISHETQQMTGSKISADIFQNDLATAFIQIDPPISTNEIAVHQVILKNNPKKSNRIIVVIEIKPTTKYYYVDEIKYVNSIQFGKSTETRELMQHYVNKYEKRKKDVKTKEKQLKMKCEAEKQEQMLLYTQMVERENMFKMKYQKLLEAISIQDPSENYAKSIKDDTLRDLLELTNQIPSFSLFS